MRRSILAATSVATLLLAGCGGLTNAPVAAPTSSGELTADTCLDPAAATAVIDDAVRIGWSIPLSGPFAGTFQQISAAFEARMALFTAQGGAGGVPVEFFTADSQLDPEIAKSQGNEMVQRDGADIISTSGTGQVATMIDDAAAACVPFLASTSSSPKYRDATTYPWATLYLPPADLENRAIVADIERRFPGGATVAIARSPSEYGAVQVESFTRAAEGTSVTVVEEANLVDPAAAASTLKASGADVLFSGATGAECLALTTAIGRIGWEPEVFQNNTCADTSLYIPAGSVADGQHVFRYEVVPARPEFSGLPAVQRYLADAAAYGVADPLSSWSVTGWSIGEIHADILTRAAASPDGLTRLSIMQAARAQDFHPSTFIDGIDFAAATGGVTGLAPFRWDAAAQQFTPDGEPVVPS